MKSQSNTEIITIYPESEPNVMSVHLIFVEVFHSGQTWWTNRHRHGLNPQRDSVFNDD